MPQSSRSYKSGSCPFCGEAWIIIAWKDGFGGEEVIMEEHCRTESGCGYSVDGTGRILTQPNMEAVNRIIKSKER